MSDKKPKMTIVKKGQTLGKSQGSKIEDVKCEVYGCNEGGAMMDHDGTNKCQKHLVAEAFKKKPVELDKKYQRNEPCPCGSKLKYKKCCGNMANEHLRWFVDNIGKRVFFKEMPPNDDPTSESYKQVKRGIVIADHEHARKLFLYAEQNKIQFTTKIPEYNKIKI